MGMGIFFAFFYLLVVIAPWLAGVLAKMVGTAGVAFDLGAAMLVLCCIGLWVFRRLATRV